PPAVHARHAAPAPSHPRPRHDPGPAASGAGDPPAGEETLSEAEIVALRAELRAELDRLRGTMAPRARRSTEDGDGD
ncbi:MAG: hypothetical protein K6T27_06015, partial [Thermoleophilum sp.]|nr:hypothetical protein [Thermoleophilum sp.]